LSLLDLLDLRPIEDSKPLAREGFSLDPFFRSHYKSAPRLRRKSNSLIQLATQANAGDNTASGNQELRRNLNWAALLFWGAGAKQP
jgi:hypothetical protein